MHWGPYILKDMKVHFDSNWIRFRSYQMSSRVLLAAQPILCKKGIEYKIVERLCLYHPEVCSVEAMEHPNKGMSYATTQNPSFIRIRSILRLQCTL